MGDFAPLGRSLHRRAGHYCADRSTERDRERRKRCFVPTSVHLTTGFARGATRDAGPSVRVPGRADPGPASHHRNARGADPYPGLFQFRACLSSQSRSRRGALRGGTSALIGASNFFDGGRGRHQSLRLQFRGGPCHRGRRLIEVPVMLSVVKIVNNTRDWYEAGGGCSSAPSQKDASEPWLLPSTTTRPAHVAQHAGDH